MASEEKIVERKEDVLKYLFSLEKFGIKLGLNNITALLEEQGNPHRKFKSIHIAGTNGKGSVSSLISSILQECGFKVGLYTSPHLINFNERIKINGKEIIDDDLIRYTKMFRDRINNHNATFFEATTAIAFKYFFDSNVDFAVIETGLGGRMDATNVLEPEISVITEIGIDHKEQLGDTIEQIAFEKAGIIKYSTDCITGATPIEALKILEKTVSEKSANLYNSNGIFQYKIKELHIDNMILDISGEYIEFKNINSPFIGDHQARNICTSILTILRLKNNLSLEINKEKIRYGVQNVIKNTNLHGRIEQISEFPRIIFDVAHNYDAIKKLCEILSIFNFKNVYLIFGIMKDKEYEKVIKSLSDIIYEGFAFEIGGKRALEREIIQSEFRKYGKDILPASDINIEIKKIMERMDKDDLLLITGSHYVCGEALNSASIKNTLDILMKNCYI